MSELKFKEARVEPFEWGSIYGLMLWFEDDDGKRYRHAVRIPVGKSMTDTLNGLKGFIEWFEVNAEERKSKVD